MTTAAARPGAGDVAHHDAEAVVGEDEGVEPVAADAEPGGGHEPRRHLDALDVRQAARQQAALQDAGRRAFARGPLREEGSGDALPDDLHHGEVVVAEERR